MNLTRPSNTREKLERLAHGAEPIESLDDAIKRRLREGATKAEVCRELGVDRAKVDAMYHYIFSDPDAE